MRSHAAPSGTERAAAASSSPASSLRERCDAELAAARTELPKAAEECRTAGAAFEAAQRERVALTIRFAPITAHVESSRAAMAPLLADELKATQDRFEVARKAWGAAEGRELAAKRRLAAAELADAQLKLIGE